MRTASYLIAVVLELALTLGAVPAQAETTACNPIASLPATITVQGIYCFTQHLTTSMTSKLERSFVGVLASIYGQSASPSLPRSPWDPRAVSDPRIVVNEFPDDLRDASLGGGDNRSASRRREALADYLNVPLKEILDAALAAELAPAPALPGMPRVRQRLPRGFPRRDQDQRAIKEVQQTLSSMFASTGAFLRGMKFLGRVTS